MRRLLEKWGCVPQRLVLLILLVLFYALALNGCAWLKTAPTWDDLTPKGKAAFALSIYNTEYDQYMIDVRNPDLGTSEKEFLEAKKQVLKEIRSPLSAYCMYVDAGKIPNEQMELGLIMLLDRLLDMQRQGGENGR